MAKIQKSWDAAQRRKSIISHPTAIAISFRTEPSKKHLLCASAFHLPREISVKNDLVGNILKDHSIGIGYNTVTVQNRG